MQTTESPKVSRYLAAGSPVRCQLPACQTPFDGTCFCGNDGKFYCSHACADQGERERPRAKVEQFRPRPK
jgi:hypothetical protein